MENILHIESHSSNDTLMLDGNLLTDLNVKYEQQSITDAEASALVKDRQKKDNHNMSKFFSIHH